MHENFQETQTETEQGIRQGEGGEGPHKRESMHARMYDCMQGTYVWEGKSDFRGLLQAGATELGFWTLILRFI